MTTRRRSTSIRPSSLFEEETSCDFDRECLNGGRCEAGVGLASDSSRCVCDPAYTGRRCELPVVPEEEDDDEATTTTTRPPWTGCGSDEDCRNGGRCEFGGAGLEDRAAATPSLLAGRCECPATRYGSRCEDACPCLHGGTCLSSPGTGLLCRCPDGFVDALCATRLDGFTLPDDGRGARWDARLPSGVLLFFLVLGIVVAVAAAARKSRRRRRGTRSPVWTGKNEEGWDTGMVGEAGNPSVERLPGGGGILYRDEKLGGGGGGGIEVEEGLPIREDPSMDDDTLPTNLSDLEPTFT